jgi:Protein of unknown function (DUF3106)
MGAATLACLTLAFALTLLPSQGAWAVASAQAQTLSNTTSWASLSAPQKQALAPLASQWASLDNTSQEKWLSVAEKFPKLSPQAQQRMHSRMTQWAQVPAQQRGEARLRFQNARQISAQERQQKWAAYQALPADEREVLAKQANRKRKPVVLSDAEPGPREAYQQASRKRADTATHKTNLVPDASRVTAAPEAVAPTLVKAGPGATTTLITQSATPPLHQHTGLHKINADKGFVDPKTLLPRTGSQGAAMTPVSASQADSAAAASTSNKR